jgi:copper(I)-binding protein
VALDKTPNEIPQEKGNAMSDFLIDLLRKNNPTATDQQIEDAATRANAEARADGGGFVGLYNTNSGRSSAISIMERAMADTMAAANTISTSE